MDKFIIKINLTMIICFNFLNNLNILSIIIIHYLKIDKYHFININIFILILINLINDYFFKILMKFIHLFIIVYQIKAIEIFRVIYNFI